MVGLVVFLGYLEDLVLLVFLVCLVCQVDPWDLVDLGDSKLRIRWLDGLFGCGWGLGSFSSNQPLTRCLWQIPCRN